jgi:hypothetical protein
MTEAAIADPAVNRRHLPHRLDAGIAERAAIGLIVLATDQTIEHEVRHLLDLPGSALYHSRILNDARITPETLGAMESQATSSINTTRPRPTSGVARRRSKAPIFSVISRRCARRLCRLGAAFLRESGFAAAGAWVAWSTRAKA